MGLSPGTQGAIMGFFNFRRQQKEEEQRIYQSVMKAAQAGSLEMVSPRDMMNFRKNSPGKLKVAELTDKRAKTQKAQADQDQNWARINLLSNAYDRVQKIGGTENMQMNIYGQLRNSYQKAGYDMPEWAAHQDAKTRKEVEINTVATGITRDIETIRSGGKPPGDIGGAIRRLDKLGKKDLAKDYESQLMQARKEAAAVGAEGRAEKAAIRKEGRAEAATIRKEERAAGATGAEMAQAMYDPENRKPISAEQWDVERAGADAGAVSPTGVDPKYNLMRENALRGVKGVKGAGERVTQQDAESGTGFWSSMAAFTNASLGGVLGTSFFEDTQDNRHKLRMLQKTGVRIFMNSSRGPVWEQKWATDLFPQPATIFSSAETEARKLFALRAFTTATRAENDAIIRKSNDPKQIRAMRDSNIELDRLLNTIGGPSMQPVTEEEYDSLPSGAMYTAPDGTRRRKS